MTFRSFTHLSLLLAGAGAYPSKRAVTPQVSGTPEPLGVVSDPRWNRDSCTSVHVRKRELWTCRDSQSSDAFLSSTASWTNFSSNGTPAVSNGVLTMYGNNPTDSAYFPNQANECGGSGGACDDDTRYAIRPDTRLLPVDIPKAHLTSDLASLVQNPAASLYRSDFTPGGAEDDLPPVTLVDEEFWAQGEIQFGNYGFVIRDGFAYLYGNLNGTSGIALAKVALHQIENKTAYSYWTGSAWSSTAPSITDTSAAIPNAGTGRQGTYYWSSYFSSFVWIGSPWVGCNADFQIATATAPEGPWSEPVTFYSGAIGSASCGAYSQQAHPGLSKNYGSGNDIYLTYTKVDDVYSTQLIHVVWQ